MEDSNHTYNYCLETDNDSAAEHPVLSNSATGQERELT